jgi:hypothetical protein
MSTHWESACRAKREDDLQGSPGARSAGERQAGATPVQSQPLAPPQAPWGIPRASGGQRESASWHHTILQGAHAHLETPLIVYLYHGDEAG